MNLYHARRDLAAVEHFLPLAKLGLAEAQYRVAKICLRECGSKATSNILRPIAERWLSRAQDAGHPLAIFELSTSFEDRPASPSSKGSASMPLEVDQQEILKHYAAYLEAEHQGVSSRSAIDAVEKHLVVAAKGGLVEAMRDLGEHCWSQAKKKEAITWMERAARKNSLHAKLRLSFWYFIDLEVQDHSKATRWYKEAALDGSSEGTFHLGQSYLERGSTKNSVSAGLDLIQIAAYWNNHDAQLFLVRCFENGFHGVKDPAMARTWRERSERWADREEARSLAFAGYVRELDGEA